MSEHIRGLIDALADKDYTTAKSAYDAAVSDKMTDALDARRIEIASNIYDNGSAEDESIGSDELSSEEE
jgi:hypothetical protein|tara:strand:+ start:293 stop:499 length:207 start_codon:yes stop_codon:yes gene_type:complete